MADKQVKRNDMGKYTVLMTLPDAVPRESKDEFRKHFNVITYDQLIEDHERYGSKVLGVIMFPVSGVHITRELLDKMPNLKVFSVYAAAYQFLDLEMLRERGIRVYNLGDKQSDDMADLVMGMLLGLSRRIIAANYEYKKAGLQYYLENVFRFRSKAVTGTALGIVGMGNIGYQVAVRAKAFKMNIFYHNRRRRPEADEASVGAEFIPKLHDMLPLVDTVVVCCPLTAATQDLFSTSEFNLMRSDAVFINVGRGKIVDTDALVVALQNGSIGAAGLDVTNPEPLPDSHPLLNMQNVVITPHIGCCTYTTQRILIETVIDNIFAGIEGTHTSTEIDLGDESKL